MCGCRLTGQAPRVLQLPGAPGYGATPKRAWCRHDHMLQEQHFELKRAPTCWEFSPVPRTPSLQLGGTGRIAGECRVISSA